MENFTLQEHIRLMQNLDYQEKFLNTPLIDLKDGYLNANAINVDLDAPIYRIFSYEKLIMTLKSKSLCLVKPELWDDPFENFLLKSNGLYNGANVSFEPLREKLYGQCWSLKEECDGLWRNYTNNSCKNCTCCDWFKRHGKQCISVKVKTTVRKLFGALYDINNPFHCVNYFIGRVNYISDKEIVNYLKTAFDEIKDSTGVGIVNSLLIKRTPFKYEEEVRLIFNKPNDNDANFSSVMNKWDSSNKFFIKINPTDLFDEMETDPWIEDDIFSKISEEIKANNYAGAINRSGLYNEPFFSVKIK